MRHSNLIILFVITMFVLGVIGCQTKEVVSPTATPFPGGDILKALNNPPFSLLDALECPSEHPNYLVPGEASATNEIYKKKLYDFGVKVRWNCKKKLYEIVPDGQSSSPICGCSSQETPLPTAVPSP